VRKGAGMSAAETALAKMFSVFLSWAASARDPWGDSRMVQMGHAMVGAGLIEVNTRNVITDEGRDLLDRARKAGVL
jgi:hypothetical protein